MTSDSRFSISDDLKQNYDAYYSEASDWRALGARHKASNIIEMCSSIPHARLIEIGSGDGSVSAELSRRDFGESITCIDVSESGRDVTRGRAIPRVDETLVFDGYHIPFDDRTFDLAICTHVLEHVEHERAFLVEAARVADHLFIEVPLEDTIRLGRNYVPDPVGHINFYNPTTIRRLLQTTGLEVLDHRLFETPLDVLRFSSRSRGTLQFAVRRVADTISRSLASRVFVYHSGILCRKPD